jgi:hypothetical protein
MASGDAVNALASVAASGTLNIQPGAGNEWIVHNIFLPEGSTSGVEVYAVTGAVECLLKTVTDPLLTFNFHVTNTYFLKLKNLAGVNVVLGYDGIVVK